jgi:hypothetical protein
MKPKRKKVPSSVFVETPEQRERRERHEPFRAREREAMYAVRTHPKAGALHSGRSSRARLQGFSWYLSQLYGRGHEFVLPNYQRPAVWDEDRQLSYLRYVLNGGIITPIFLLEDGIGRYLVVDGQQRLNALSVPMTTLSGTPSPQHDFRLDPDTYDFIKDPSLPSLNEVMALDFMNDLWNERELAFDGRGSVDAYLRKSTYYWAAKDFVNAVSFPVITAGWGPIRDFGEDFEEKLFRAINTQGVQMSEEQLEDLIATAKAMRQPTGGNP